MRRAAPILVVLLAVLAAVPALAQNTGQGYVNVSVADYVELYVSDNLITLNIDPATFLPLSHGWVGSVGTTTDPDDGDVKDNWNFDNGFSNVNVYVYVNGVNASTPTPYDSAVFGPAESLIYIATNDTGEYSYYSPHYINVTTPVTGVVPVMPTGVDYVAGSILKAFVTLPYADTAEPAAGTNGLDLEVHAVLGTDNKWYIKLTADPNDWNFSTVNGVVNPAVTAPTSESEIFVYYNNLRLMVIDDSTAGTYYVTLAPAWSLMYNASGSTADAATALVKVLARMPAGSYQWTVNLLAGGWRNW